MNKKEKIKAFKSSHRPMGVYQVRNKLNGKVLIGASRNLPAILNRMQTELKFGTCRNQALQRDWARFGAEAFAFEELELLEPLDDPAYDPAEDLRYLETLWSEKLRPYGDKGYNQPPR